MAALQELAFRSQDTGIIEATPHFDWLEVFPNFLLVHYAQRGKTEIARIDRFSELAAVV